jgi:hypothetical protein
VYLTPRDGRPSTRAFVPVTSGTPACAPAVVLRAPEAQVSLLGSPAVSIRVRTAPIFGLPVTGGLTSKINNSISTIAKGEGTAVSAADKQDHQVQVDKVTGWMAAAINARGVPPRGRPV